MTLTLRRQELEDVARAEFGLSPAAKLVFEVPSVLIASAGDEVPVVISRGAWVQLCKAVSEVRVVVRAGQENSKKEGEEEHRDSVAKSAVVVDNMTGA
jgi:hypothetical protein